MSAEEVAKAFVGHYYNTFDTNRAGLASLYQPVSVMTWDEWCRQCWMVQLSEEPAYPTMVKFLP